MRLTIDADRTSVTYVCLDCRDRLTLPAATVGRAGAAFVQRHRGCARITDLAAPAPAPMRRPTAATLAG